MTSSADDDALPAEFPNMPSIDEPPRWRLWLWLPLILAGGLVCGGLTPSWQTADTEILDPFTTLDESEDIFLGAAAPLSDQASAEPAISSAAAETLELPVLPGWDDVANVNAPRNEPPEQQWAAYETTTNTGNVSPVPSAPVWLDGTIELLSADDVPPRPLQQAFGPTSYQR